MNRQDIPVVFSTDHNFIMPTYVAMSSLLANASRRCEIYLLVSEDVTDDDKEIINRLAAAHDAGLTFIAVGTVFDNSFCVRGITKATYFRLLIPWIIPDRDKVIYLDGDIVVSGDIAQLYDYPADPACLICGVRTPGFSTSDKIRKEIEAKGLDCKGYINAGILIFNSRLLREEDYKPKFLAHIDKQYSFQDQDILNITCAGRIGYLPLKFNFIGLLRPEVKAKFIELGLATPAEVADAELHPVIIHYAGAKPWRDFTARWCDWVNYYRQSPFYNQELIDGISSKILFPVFNLKKVIKCLLKRY